VQKENWVLESLFEELFSGIGQQKNVSVVKRVSNLKSVDGICISSNCQIINLFGSESVLIKTVIEFYFFDESSL
jgi:hypothetical protein